MTIAPDRIAVIAMQLARTDPRALSQAWYDALHRAQPSPAAPAPVQHANAAPEPERPIVRRDAAARAATPARPASQRHAHAAAVHATVRDADLATRRVARTILSTIHAPRACARTVALGGSRIRLLVRTDAAGTRIVALCAPADRERVARTLAQVRVALAGAGVTLAA